MLHQNHKQNYQQSATVNPQPMCLGKATMRMRQSRTEADERPATKKAEERDAEKARQERGKQAINKARQEVADAGGPPVMMPLNVPAEIAALTRNQVRVNISTQDWIHTVARKKWQWS